MSTVQNGQIVTSGLVLALDAANPRSYTSGSLVWRDLSPNLITGSLINGPTFDSNNGGSLVFDGVDDYVNCSSTNFNSISVFAFIYPSRRIGVNIYPMIINKWDELSNNRSWVLDYESNNDKYGVAISNNGTFNTPNVKYYNTTNTINYNTWQQIGFTFNSGELKIYLNGVEPLITKNIDSAITSIFTSNTLIKIGSYTAPFNGFYSGSMSNIQIYNRALSATEVLQNYNATKTRFGL